MSLFYTKDAISDFEKILNGLNTFDSFPPLRILSLATYCRKEEVKDFFSFIDSNGDTCLTFIIQSTVENNVTQQYRSIVDKFKLLEENIELLNLPNSYGETPLHVSSISNNIEFMKLLVLQGVDGSLKDNRNMTALDIAVMMDHKTIIKELKKLKTSMMTMEQTSIYQWGQILTSSLTLKSCAKATNMLFNDEISAPIQTEFGQNYNLILTDTGAVYSSGLCSYGKTGHKKKRDVLIPTQILELSNKRIKSIACGTHHSLAMDDLGQVYSWGNGASGRLGLGNDFSIVPTPTLISVINRFGSNEIATAIAAGCDNSMILGSNGDVYSFGSNLHYKLGYKECDGALGFQSTPKKIPSILQMKSIACASWHSVFLDLKGRVYTCGSSTNGRLGRAISSYSSFYPERVSITNSKTNGTLPQEEVIKQIACGTNFTTVLSESGSLYSWGVNTKSQLGLINLVGISEYYSQPKLVTALNPYTIHSFAVGDQHVVALSDQGEVFCYGDNSTLQCGFGEVLNFEINLTKVKIETTSSDAPIIGGGGVFKVSAGGSNTMISLSSDHNIFGEELLKSLNLQMFTDCRLIINDNKEQFIQAHQVVLAARSNKFNKLLELQHNSTLVGVDQQQQQQQQCKIPLTQTTFLKSFIESIGTFDIDGNENRVLYISFPSISSISILSLLLKYIYSDHTILSQSTNQELGELAHSLEIERLAYLCNFSHGKSLDKLPTSTLLEDFRILKDPKFSSIYSDIKFKCINNGGGGGDGNMVDEAYLEKNKQQIETVESYKLFAYTGSSYFKTMLSGSFIESNKKEIELFETSASSLRLLLNYCYSEEIPTDSNDCIDCIIICDVHQISRAKDSCAAKIRSQIDIQYICYIYHISLIYNVKLLKTWCQANFNSIADIKALPYFNQLPIEIQSELNSIKKKY
ncbi:ankyrin repeat-containing protein [Dictyostelium discoideum AX4]|uniref:Ankyrin repeat-containing protein n=1 Tax=Dictyostelium discoideum TaxID=44689 RepID=Q54S74_DICDI|nr:ankyrin repeat-containing protein [Dictyostelium discoideum AX4]EAL66176.2 ankyrin repeat-containing protein [Dictyostelium discoideum AX4]|eukprot:XP_640165.2 ankyrin repeat-containing protein [Dictyostelium discoideum AX4]